MGPPGRALQAEPGAAADSASAELVAGSSKTDTPPERPVSKEPAPPAGEAEPLRCALLSKGRRSLLTRRNRPERLRTSFQGRSGFQPDARLENLIGECFLDIHSGTSGACPNRSTQRRPIVQRLRKNGQRVPVGRIVCGLFLVASATDSSVAESPVQVPRGEARFDGVVPPPFSGRTTGAPARIWHFAFTMPIAATGCTPESVSRSPKKKAFGIPVHDFD